MRITKYLYHDDKGWLHTPERMRPEGIETFGTIHEVKVIYDGDFPPPRTPPPTRIVWTTD